jgi:fibronectin-binding autotransporter adhesin
MVPRRFGNKGLNTPRRTKVGFFLVLFILIVCTSRSYAATVTWSGATSGDWNIGTNWFGSSVPVSGDNLVFDSTAAGNFANSNTNLSVTTFGSISFDSNNNPAKGYHIGGSHTITIDGNASGSLQRISADNIGISNFEFVDFPVILTGPMSIIANGASGVLQFTNTVNLQTSLALNGTGQMLLTGTPTITETGGSRSLTKTGSGLAEISSPGSDASYTGPTVVNGGTLAITNVSIASSSGVTVNSGGTLVVQNGGTVPDVTVNAGGTLSAGTTGSPLGNTGALSLNSGSTMLVTFSSFSFPPNIASQFTVTGTVSLGGATLAVDPLTPCGSPFFVPAPGDLFTIIANDSTDPIAGTFSGMLEGSTLTVCGTLYRVSYVGGTGNDVTLSYVGAAPVGPVTSVPTLNEWGMMIFALLAGLAAVHLLRRKRAA